MGGIRGRVEASGGIRALLLPASDFPARLWKLANLSCSPVRLARGLLQKFRQAQNPEVIAMEM